LHNQTKTPSQKRLFLSLNQWSCWRRMIDSHYRLVARINTYFVLRRTAFYAISLRHLWLA
jgi:hypothetical protein